MIHLLCTGLALPEQCRVEHEVTEQQMLAVQQLLLSAAASDPADTTVSLCAVSSSCKIQRNKGRINILCNNLY
jgi:hypothetical protein